MDRYPKKKCKVTATITLVFFERVVGIGIQAESYFLFGFPSMLKRCKIDGSLFEVVSWLSTLMARPVQSLEAVLVITLKTVIKLRRKGRWAQREIK
jgi:hypothetical protein